MLELYLVLSSSFVLHHQAHTHTAKSQALILWCYIFSIKGQSHWHNYILFYARFKMGYCDLYMKHNYVFLPVTKYLNRCGWIWKMKWKADVMLRPYCADKYYKEMKHLSMQLFCYWTYQWTETKYLKHATRRNLWTSKLSIPLMLDRGRRSS